MKPSSPSRFAVFKLILLTIGTAFGAYKGIGDLLVAVGEPTPTMLMASEFPGVYDDEKWIGVQGRVLAEHASVRPSSHRVHAGKSMAYVDAPVVGDDWGPTQPVFVIATFGPFDPAELDQWLSDAASLSEVVGEVRPVPLRDAAERLQLSIGEPVVVINEGTRPSLGGSILFLGMMVVFGGLAAHVLVGLWRERR